ncbi:MAG: MBG domain-containing protein [Verrucomicrobia bacterium]|nr:MBG domain-containing protein [Verrucomicrobiota bacterium]
MNNDGAGFYFAIVPDTKLGIQDNLVQDGWVSIKLLAWRGTAPSYESANTADKFFVWDGTNHVDAATFPFLNQVGTFVAPAQLDGMPAMQLGLGLAPTTNVLTSSLNPSTYGASVTLTATLSTNDATGSVTFLDGTNTLGSGSLTNGVATFTTSSLSVGNHLVWASYAGDTNYLEASSDILTQVVNKASATIQLTGLNQTYAFGPLTVTATTTPSNLPVVITYNAGPALPVNAGSYTVVATINHTNYAGSVTNTLVVEKAPMLVIADYKSRVYGNTNPVFTASYSGIISNPAPSSIGKGGSTKVQFFNNPVPFTGSPSLTTTADPASPVGAYTITAALGSLESSNYNFSFTNGVLTIEQAVVTVAAVNKSRAYGSSNPTLTASYTGWLNSDNETVYRHPDRDELQFCLHQRDTDGEQG